MVGLSLFLKRAIPISEQISGYRYGDGRGQRPDVEASVSGVIGVGTLASIIQELDMLKPRARKRFMADAGHLLIEGKRVK